MPTATRNRREQQTANLLTIRETAERLAWNERSIWTAIATGDLPVVRLSRRATRVHPADLERFIETRRG